MTPDLLSDVQTEVTRVVDRLRSMPLARLSAPWQDYPSMAAGARALAQLLVDRAALLTGWPVREVPDVGDAAVGDQVAVTAADLLALAPPDAVLAEVGTDLREYRLSL